jgi:quercetin dioxygenase-like cupin family protein
MIIRYEVQGCLKEKKVGAGDWVHCPAGCVHQEEAITDVIRIEVSTPHFNDRVRVESEFGIIDTAGLPTTGEDEIEKR